MDCSCLLYHFFSLNLDYYKNVRKKYKTSFQDIWLENDKYKLWLSWASDSYSVKCKVWSKVFSVASQGIKVLGTHAKGTKHIQRLPNSSTGKIPFTSSINTVIASEPENAAKKVKQTLIVPLMENQSTKQAEVSWTPDVVLLKYSFQSSDNKAKLLRCF